jgi:hypothetical protein
MWPSTPFAHSLAREVTMKTILSLFLGIMLVVAGTAVLTYQGITVTTAERQLLQVGPLQAATQQSNWTITLPPILGALLLAGAPFCCSSSRS